MAFKPGDKLSAKWANRVDAAAAAFNERAALGGSTAAHRIDRNVIKVSNQTGSNLLRGHYVQVGEFELDARDPRNIWFEGNLYDETSDQRIAIATNAVVDGARVDAVLIGVAVAVVDVSDTGHRYATPVDGEYVLASAASGPVEILDTVTETGSQECAVLLAGGSGEVVSIARGLATADVDEDDATFTIDNVESLRGTEPVLSSGALTVTNGTLPGTYPIACSNNDVVTAELVDGLWRPRQSVDAFWGIVTTQVSAVTDNEDGTYTPGSGVANLLHKQDGGASWVYEVLGPSKIFNMTSAVVAVDKLIQVKRIGGDLFVDVEECGGT